MVYGDCLIAQCLVQVGSLLGEELFPLRVMWDGDWGHGGMIPKAAAARGAG